MQAIGVDGSTVAVIDEACTRCGSCLPACPHDAVLVRGDLAAAVDLAAAGATLILSVEAEVHFFPLAPAQVVNACYRAGFGSVYRGVVGDELVAEAYNRLWQSNQPGTVIRSTCPVVVDTVRRIYPELVPYLAPVQTPVQAEAGYIRSKHGEGVEIVYAGVCVTEGGETVDASITIDELAELFRLRGIDPADEAPYFTRIPEERRRHVSMAGGMPLPLLEAEKHASPRFRKVRGLGQLPAIARAVVADEMDLGFIDLLPCEGCLDHPLAGPRDGLFQRRRIQETQEPPRSSTPVLDPEVVVDIEASFGPMPSEQVAEDEVEEVLRAIGFAPGGRPWDCGACGFGTCRSFAAALTRGRATYRQCPPYQERRAVKARQDATVDDLTGLATYRVLRDQVRLEIARARRSGVGFAVLFLDLDGFGEVNEVYGEEAGNRVLKMVADVLRRTVRSSDLAARFGRDEFVVLLAGSDTTGARRVGEQVRRSVEMAGRELGYAEGAITVSAGAAGYDENEDEPQVLDRADKALYRAKTGGGNRVA